MTQYYRIQPEERPYMQFDLDGFDFLNKLGEEFELSDFGTPMQHAWQPIKGRFQLRADASIVPDITTWQTDLLVLNQKAYDCLKETLEPFGEFLPIEVESDTFYLFNVLTRLPDEAIDTENSEYEYHDDEVVGFRILNFAEDNIPDDKLLFCMQNDSAYNIYCDDRLKNIIDDNDLHGLRFNTTLIDPYFK